MLLWQLLHSSVTVGICGGVVSPVAVVPLWQVAQPAVMPAWLKVAPAQLAVLEWQVEHSAVVRT